jgi:hypothetical protein
MLCRNQSTPIIQNLDQKKAWEFNIEDLRAHANGNIVNITKFFFDLLHPVWFLLLNIVL